MSVTGVLSGIDSRVLDLLSDFRNVERNSMFGCIRIGVLDRTVNLYPNGKFTLLGARDEEDVDRIQAEMLRMISVVHQGVRLVSSSVIQLTLRWNTGCGMDLYNLASRFPSCTYDPEISNVLV